MVVSVTFATADITAPTASTDLNRIAVPAIYAVCIPLFEPLPTALALFVMLGKASAADALAVNMPHVPIVMVSVAYLAVLVVAVKAAAADMDLVPSDVVGGFQFVIMPAAVIADRPSLFASVAVQPLADLDRKSVV